MRRQSFQAISVMLSLSLCLLSTSQAQTASEQGGSSATSPRIVRKAGGVLQGSATRRVTPVYPPTAKEALVSGPVVVEVTVTEEGAVDSARALMGHELLRGAAVEAARGWTFTPTTVGGVPVKVIGTITFNFTLDPDPAILAEIEGYKEQLRAKPGSADLYIKLGEAYSKMGGFKDAVEAFSQAVRFDDKSVDARKGLIRAYTRLGKKEMALETLDSLKEIDPAAAEEILKEISGDAKR
jgi:TonB family protein